MEFQNEVVVITGGANGIGRAAALQAGREGAKVIVVDINEEQGHAVTDEVQSLAGQAEFMPVDLTDVKQIGSLIAAIHKKYQHIDVLINCAGICRDTSVPDIKPEEWDLIMAINLKSVFFLCQEALKVMTPRKSGRIITIASAAGKSGGVSAGAHYSASKAAIMCLTKTLAQYAAPHQIKVNCLCPGPVETDMTAGWSDEVTVAFKERIPLKRYASPQEAADAILFLASDRAKYITGEILDLNGGLIMD
ncbi:MAG: SDR family NAD(P)-dependent oxidoreductase [Desulfobacterales bacterium]|jgi:3-oxoacyl-[acyl-carrier protein] reductase